MVLWVRSFWKSAQYHFVHHDERVRLLVVHGSLRIDNAPELDANFYAENALELLKMVVPTLQKIGQATWGHRHGGRHGQAVGARRTVGLDRADRQLKHIDRRGMAAIG